jgi:hypothetical protein
MNRMLKCFARATTNIIELLKKILPVVVVAIFLLSDVLLLKASLF